MHTYQGISFEVKPLSQFMTEPLHAHWIITKHALRYLHGMINLGLRYTIRYVRFHGYNDIDWSENTIAKKSTSGCCFNLAFATISWMSRKHKSISLSMVEAEYIAARMASSNVICLRKLFGDLFK